MNGGEKLPGAGRDGALAARDHRPNQYSHPARDVRQARRTGGSDMDDQPANAAEGADPSGEIRRQNPGETTTADLADKTAEDDPHKAEKLTKAGRDDFDPDSGSD
jgi:hypothetical protein